MNTLGLHPVYKPQDPSRRYKGIAIVIVLHVLLIWGIATGTAGNVLVKAKKSLEAVVIQEVIIPPPPPPPPKEIPKAEIAPKVDAPPPPFVPPPDIAPAVSTAPTIQSVAAPPPTPAVIAPPPPPAPTTPAPVARPTIAVACPTTVQPEMPRKATQEGVEGTVKVQLTIAGGVVKDVVFLSGPRVFYPNIRSAVMQYKCLASAGEVVATQEFVFKIE